MRLSHLFRCGKLCFLSNQIAGFFDQHHLLKDSINIIVFFYVWCYSSRESSIWDYFKGVKFDRYNISRFSQFLTIFAKFCYRGKFQDHKIAKLNTAKLNTYRAWHSLFLNIWSKSDIHTHISCVSTYSNEIGVSVTYLITITLINNRKIDIQWDFCFILLLKSQN